MAEQLMLSAKPRTEKGSRRSRRLRRHGQIPGVIYGHKEATVPVTVDDEALRSLIRHNVRVVDVQLDGKTEKCLIREVQWDAFGREVVHVDLTRVSLDERIRVMVPLQLRGTAKGLETGGVLEQPLHQVEVECLAISVPESLRVNVHELQIGQVIHLKDLTPPAGVKVFGDPEAVVVQVVKKLEEAPPAPAEAAPAGPAEPEVIGRKVAEKEEAEE